MIVDWFRRTEQDLSRLEALAEVRKDDVRMKNRVASLNAGRAYQDSRFASYTVASGTVPGTSSEREISSSPVVAPSWATGFVVVSEAPLVNVTPASLPVGINSYSQNILTRVNGEVGQRFILEVTRSPWSFVVSTASEDVRVWQMPSDRQVEISFSVSAPAYTTHELAIHIRSLVMWVTGLDSSLS